MPSLKAYEVREDFEGHCVIRFATNNATARREGAQELEIEWESVEHCIRKPEFDAYAPGPVPPTVLLEHGWWMECQECSIRIDLDSEPEDDDGNPIEFEPVDYGKRVFCCPTCQGIYFAKARANQAARAALVELIHTKFPGCTIERIHVYGERLEQAEKDYASGVHASAHFKFPGAQYGATYHFGDPMTYVSSVDAEAFKALYGRKDAAAS